MQSCLCSPHRQHLSLKTFKNLGQLHRSEKPRQASCLAYSAVPVLIKVCPKSPPSPNSAQPLKPKLSSKETEWKIELLHSPPLSPSTNSTTGSKSRQDSSKGAPSPREGPLAPPVCFYWYSSSQISLPDPQATPTNPIS